MGNGLFTPVEEQSPDMLSMLGYPQAAQNMSPLPQNPQPTGPSLPQAPIAPLPPRAAMPMSLSAVAPIAAPAAPGAPGMSDLTNPALQARLNELYPDTKPDVQQYDDAIKATEAHRDKVLAELAAGSQPSLGQQLGAALGAMIPSFINGGAGAEGAQGGYVISQKLMQNQAEGERDIAKMALTMDLDELRSLRNDKKQEIKDADGDRKAKIKAEIDVMTREIDRRSQQEFAREQENTRYGHERSLIGLRDSLSSKPDEAPATPADLEMLKSQAEIAQQVASKSGAKTTIDPVKFVEGVKTQGNIKSKLSQLENLRKVAGEQGRQEYRDYSMGAAAQEGMTGKSLNFAELAEKVNPNLSAKEAREATPTKQQTKEFTDLAAAREMFQPVARELAASYKNNGRPISGAELADQMSMNSQMMLGLKTFFQMGANWTEPEMKVLRNAVIAAPADPIEFRARILEVTKGWDAKTMATALERMADRMDGIYKQQAITYRHVPVGIALNGEDKTRIIGAIPGGTDLLTRAKNDDPEAVQRLRDLNSTLSELSKGNLGR